MLASRLLLCYHFYMKNCAGCGVEKTPENTGKDIHLKGGLSSYCRICKNRRGRKSYECIRVGLNKRRLDKRKGNREADRKWQKEWRAKNKDRIKEINKLRRLRNPEKVRAESAKSQRKNRAHRNAYKRKWREENKERIKDTMPINQKICMVIAASIRNCLYGKKKGQHWETVVGYTLVKLMKHLEKLFEPDMSWENYGKYGWHIDHKIPISAFNFETPNDLDFKRCWALKNLQPLEAKKNQSKSAKVERPFQPSLAINAIKGKTVKG